LAGISPRPIPMESITAAELGNAINTAINMPDAPRLAAAERLRVSDGRMEIVQRLEALVATASIL
ncbi:MAG: hypothetical protein ABIP02_04835, partial [Arenimonas sp.]